jgi:hypothetical protein
LLGLRVSETEPLAPSAAPNQGLASSLASFLRARPLSLAATTNAERSGQQRLWAAQAPSLRSGCRYDAVEHAVCPEGWFKPDIVAEIIGAPPDGGHNAAAR